MNRWIGALLLCLTLAACGGEATSSKYAESTACREAVGRVDRIVDGMQKRGSRGNGMQASDMTKPVRRLEQQHASISTECSDALKAYSTILVQRMTQARIFLAYCENKPDCDKEALRTASREFSSGLRTRDLMVKHAARKA